MSEWDVLFAGGTVVTEERLFAADIAVADGRIVKIGPDLSRNAAEVVDATGLHVFAGFIDSHVHFNEPGREHWEGLLSGSRSLAAGGGTVFFDMPLNASPPTLTGQDFEAKKVSALEKSLLDFGLWGGLTPVNLDSMEELADAGVIGFKAFMSRSGTDDFPNSNPKTLKRGMQIATERGLPVGVHAEDDEMTARLAQERRRAGRVSWRDYKESRPLEAELLAIRIALDLAGETGCDLHIVHVSCPEGVDLIREARLRGIRVTAETCPHYLLLTEEAMSTLGSCAKCAPPLRDDARRQKLWEDLRNSRIDTIASDHSPAPPEMKLGEDFFAVWGGISSCQHAFPLALAELRARAADEGLRRFAAVAAANVADRFRLGSQKGRIREGLDADLTLIDFRKPERIKAEQIFYRHVVTPFIGWDLGAVVTETRVRGQAVFCRGKFRTGLRARLLTPSQSAAAIV